jgi:predicted HAD superfamily Cof-like phosphohydrolase
MRSLSQFDMVKEFSEATGGSPPFELNSQFDDMKIGLIQEEYDEFFEALKNEVFLDTLTEQLTPEQAKENILKELVDMVYVILGYAHYRSWDFDSAFRRVHQSNMSKVPEDGVIQYHPNGKVKKPDSYKPANLGDLI